MATKRKKRGGASTLALVLAGCGTEAPAPNDVGGPDRSRAGERATMVREQIEARGVRDTAVLSAMREVPRHEFVPANARPHAYIDSALSIDHEQTISQPYIVAFMTEALQLQPGDKVLEIGTGSGYQAAVLAALGCDVFSIEIVKPLAERAARTLRTTGYTVQVRAGDGYQGWPEAAPFDAVIVTAAPDHVPQPLVDQLRVGGRMILPVGDASQNLLLLEKTPAGINERRILPVRFVPMTGAALDRKR